MELALPERTAVVCDDEQFIRALVVSVIERLGFAVHACGNAAEAFELIGEVDPDLLVIDLDLGEGPTGIDVVRSIQRQHPWIACVVLTGHRSPRLVREALPSSVEGVSYLVKSDMRSAADLADAVESAIHGVLTAPEHPDELPKITEMQADLLRMITEGLSNEEIARNRDSSLRSVERMVVRLYRLLGIETHAGVNARVIAARMYRDGQVTIR